MDMFRTDQYSAWDEQGLPTIDKEGKPVRYFTVLFILGLQNHTQPYFYHNNMCVCENGCFFFCGIIHGSLTTSLLSSGDTISAEEVKEVTSSPRQVTQVVLATHIGS